VILRNGSVVLPAPRKGGTSSPPAYREINPQIVVPTLIDGDIMFQSLAILEYLEEKFPEPPLLPADAEARAWVRGIALINAADSQPLIVARSALFVGRPEGQRRAKTRVDPALARHRPAGE
jgi:glutathione S-transferase